MKQEGRPGIKREAGADDEVEFVSRKRKKAVPSRNDEVIVLDWWTRSRGVVSVGDALRSPIEDDPEIVLEARSHGLEPTMTPTWPYDVAKGTAEILSIWKHNNTLNVMRTKRIVLNGPNKMHTI